MRETASSGKVNFSLDQIKSSVDRSIFALFVSRNARENLVYFREEGTIGRSGDNSEKAINLVSHVVTLGVK